MSRKMRVRPREERPVKDATDESAIKDQAERYAHAKDQEKTAKSRVDEIKSMLLPQMLDAGKKKVKVDFDEQTDATVAVKHREKMTIDPDRLKNKIGAKAFNKLTTPQLDEAKVEAAIQLGDIDANDVAACTEESSTPYLECRFTKKKRR